MSIIKQFLHTRSLYRKDLNTGVNRSINIQDRGIDSRPQCRYVEVGLDLAIEAVIIDKLLNETQEAQGSDGAHRDLELATRNENAVLTHF